jgi:hypothetical protein
MKMCLESRWAMWSPSSCLKNLLASHVTKKCFSARFLSPKEVLAKSPQNGLGCDLQLGI